MNKIRPSPTSSEKEKSKKEFSHPGHRSVRGSLNFYYFKTFATLITTYATWWRGPNVKGYKQAAKGGQMSKELFDYMCCIFL